MSLRHEAARTRTVVQPGQRRGSSGTSSMRCSQSRGTPRAVKTGEALKAGLAAMSAGSSTECSCSRHMERATMASLKEEAKA